MALLSPEIVSWLRHHQRITHGVIALIWSIFFIFFFLEPGPIQNVLRLIDLQFADALAVKGRLTAPNPNIVFLGIDNASIQMDALDPDLVKKDPVLSMMAKDWPWNREIYAAVLDRLTQAGAKVVVFDILFLHATPHDAAFKAALDRAGDRVVLGCNVLDDGKSLDLPSDTLIPQTLPLDPRTAMVNFWPDREDHVIRRTRFQIPYLGPSIGQAHSDILIDSFAARVLKILGREDRIPPPGHQYWFRFTGSFQTFSLYQLFYAPDWKNVFQNGDYFKDKIVMVGPRGNFQQDEHNTPFGPMDGAEIHLQALNAALQGDLHGELLDYLGTNPLWLMVLVAMAGFIAWLLGITMERVTLVRVTICVMLALALGAIYFYSGVTLYSHQVILAAAAPFGTLIFTMVTGLGGQYILEQFERTRTRRFFERYVSAKIVKELMDNPGGYDESRSGRRREVTILFSDLRGFTSMTEKADSEQLVRELNEYLQEMTKALFENDGILDKFIGDAVMAVWGSFTPHPRDDCRQAILAGLAMHRELAALNVRRRARGLKDLAMGVGINHGEAVVGDIGSAQQMNFTVIGDSVNLASRLEGTTKEYGVGILISETMEELVRPFFHLQTVDSIVVKGRVKPVMTYTVHGVKEETLSAQKVAYLDKYEEAMRLYRSEKFVQAKEGFAVCLAIMPGDNLAEIFEERSAEFAVTPPPQPWDGSYTMKTK